MKEMQMRLGIGMMGVVAILAILTVGVVSAKIAAPFIQGIQGDGSISGFGDILDGGEDGSGDGSDAEDGSGGDGSSGDSGSRTLDASWTRFPSGTICRGGTYPLEAEATDSAGNLAGQDFVIEHRISPLMQEFATYESSTCSSGGSCTMSTDYEMVTETGISFRGHVTASDGETASIEHRSVTPQDCGDARIYWDSEPSPRTAGMSEDISMEAEVNRLNDAAGEMTLSLQYKTDSGWDTFSSTTCFSGDAEFCSLPDSITLQDAYLRCDSGSMKATFRGRVDADGGETTSEVDVTASDTSGLC